jgi:undecaprenyl-diphosphatase
MIPIIGNGAAGTDADRGSDATAGSAAVTAAVGRPPEEGRDTPGAGVEVVGYARSPRDVLRLLVCAVAALFFVASAAWAESSILGAEQDLLRLLNFLPSQLERLLTGVVQILSVVAFLAGIVVPIRQRRLRLFGYVVLASVVTLAMTSLIEAAVRRADAPVVVNELATRAGVRADLFPDVGGIAQVVAVFAVLSPFVSRRWRRAGWTLAGVLVVLELALSVHLPVSLFAAVAIGATVGAGVLVLFGRPNQRPTMEAISAALRGAGLPVADLRPASVDARGSMPYFGILPGGQGLFVKVLGADQRSADLLFRVYRWLRLKHVGDERPFSSLRRTVEHEAFVALLARDVGVRTPRLRAAAAVGEDAMLLAYERIAGRSLDRYDGEVSDGLLEEIWTQVEILRRHGIAHRDLRRANLFVDDHGQCWVIDFGFSEVAASPMLLNNDVAQLLASLAVQVGAERSVGAAVRVCGTAAVADALPRLQLNAFSGATRTALKQQKGLLKQLQRTVADRAGVQEIHLEDLHRVNRQSVLTLVLLVAVTYFIAPQLADLPGIFREVKDANWAFAGPLLAASALTYVGAAASMMGVVPQRLRIVPTFVAQVASSFASKAAPSVIGGMALNVRYLQSSGVDPAVAVSGVGLNTVGGVVVHVFLLVLFFVWAGRSAFGSINLPDPRYLLYGVVAVVVLAALSFAVPSVRRLIREKAWPVIRRAGSGIAAVARQPGKLTLLVGGSILVTAGYILAVQFALQAFGASIPFAQVGAVYLAAATLATAAPTPGGLGALEAALIAGLTAAGLPSTIAVPAVFLFRLFTFWLPVLPGWLGFRWLRNRDYL